MLLLEKKPEGFVLTKKIWGVGQTPKEKNTIVNPLAVLIDWKVSSITLKPVISEFPIQILTDRWISATVNTGNDLLEVRRHFEYVGSTDKIVQPGGALAYQGCYIYNGILKYVEYAIVNEEVHLDAGPVLSNLPGKSLGNLLERWEEKERKKRQIEKRARFVADREIYATKSGNLYVNIGKNSYALRVLDGEKNSYTVGDDHESYNSEDLILHTWLQAAREVGVPPRYSWRGIMSALGDHGSVSPPWRAHERNYARDEKKTEEYRASSIASSQLA